MIRVGIVGATGYTALELLKLLSRHPQVEVTAVTSRDSNTPPLADVHPELRGLFDLNFQTFELDAFSQQVDTAFCCLPHAASAEIVAQLLERQIKVIDFSADYRLNDVATFETWYQVTHPDPDRVGHVAYGIPEFFRDEIKNAPLVANPGCFPSSALLPLVPLIRAGMIASDHIIVDSKTGISGAGRKPSLKFHFPECNESIAAYAIGTHRHAPEIQHLIQRAANQSPTITFTPHVVAMNRGILSTIYTQPTPGVSAADINQTLAEAYQTEPFVRVVSESPMTRQISGTNFCDMVAFDSGPNVVILSALDNLIKGASGAAVQNFNLMHGLDETTALR